MKPALLEIPVSGRIKTTPERTQLSICERRSGQIIQNKPCAFPAPRITCETEHHGNTARGHVGDSLCLNPISTSPEIIRILIQISLHNFSGFTGKWFQGSLFCVWLWRTLANQYQSSATWLDWWVQLSSARYPGFLKMHTLVHWGTKSWKCSWICQQH